VFQHAEKGELCGVYYEQQELQRCALHSVNCVLHSEGKSTTYPGLMTWMDGRSEAECAKTGWNDNAIRSVLRENSLSFDDVTQYHDGGKPNATAWIIHTGHHWHAYVKNKAGTWFDVESYNGDRSPENWCPVYVGDDKAMMTRLREFERPKGSRIYRVEQESPMQNSGSGQGGFSEAPKPAMSGMWSCECCEAENEPAADKCAKCTLLKPKPIGEGQGGFSKPSKPDKKVEGQWICKSYTNMGTVCEVKNKPTSMKCSSCKCWNPIMFGANGNGNGGW